MNKKQKTIELRSATPETLIHITTTKEAYKKSFSLKGRIGLYILRLIGVVTLEFIENE